VSGTYFDLPAATVRSLALNFGLYVANIVGVLFLCFIPILFGLLSAGVSIAPMLCSAAAAFGSLFILTTGSSSILKLRVGVFLTAASVALIWILSNSTAIGISAAGIAVFIVGLKAGEVDQSRRRLSYLMLVTVALLASALLASRLWPKPSLLPVTDDVLTQFRVPRIEQILDGRLFVALSASVVAFLGGLVLLGRRVFWLWQEPILARSQERYPKMQIRPGQVIPGLLVPITVWMSVVVIRLLVGHHGPLSKAFFLTSIGNAIPDPALFDVCAVAAITCYWLTGHIVDRGSFANALELTMVALPLLTFAPLLIPPVFTSGQLVVISFVAPIGYLMFVQAKALNRDPGRQRRLCMLAGTSCLPLALVAFARWQGLITTGSFVPAIAYRTTSLGVGPMAHLRVLLVVPLLVSLVAFNGQDPESGTRSEVPEPTEDLAASVLLLAAKDGDLDATYSPYLKPWLAAMRGPQRLEIALRSARRTIDRYRRPRGRGPTKKELQAALNAISRLHSGGSSRRSLVRYREELRHFTRLQDNLHPAQRLAIEATIFALAEALENKEHVVKVLYAEIEECAAHVPNDVYGQDPPDIREAYALERIRRQLRDLKGFNPGAIFVRLIFPRMPIELGET